MPYAFVWLGLFSCSFALSAGGLPALAMMLFPLPIALYWAGGQKRLSLHLLGCAVLSSVLSAFSLWLSLAFAIVAALGFPLGLGLREGWRYGRCVAVLMMGLFPLLSLDMYWHWGKARHAATIFINARIEELETLSTGEDNAATEVLVEFFRSADLNWHNVVIGANFGLLLLTSAAAVALLFRWARRVPNLPEPVGSFRETRCSEWLVWLAIACALLCFAEHRWESPMLRMVAWNSAVALAFVYWMNGLSILLYALSVYKAHALLYLALLVGLFYLGLMPVLALLGLFDTWYDFRPRIAKRRAKTQAKANGPQD